MSKNPKLKEGALANIWECKLDFNSGNGYYFHKGENRGIWTAPEGCTVEDGAVWGEQYQIAYQQMYQWKVAQQQQQQQQQQQDAEAVAKQRQWAEYWQKLTPEQQQYYVQQQQAQQQSQ